LEFLPKQPRIQKETMDEYPLRGEKIPQEGGNSRTTQSKKSMTKENRKGTYSVGTPADKSSEIKRGRP